MITYNEYIEYKTLSSREEVFDWLRKREIYSNSKHYAKQIVALVEYKDSNAYNYKKKENKRSYSPIYAHTFKIMIPQNLNNSVKHDFANKFIVNFDIRFKRNLYCYHFIKTSDGEYIEFMMFTRYSFKRKMSKTIKYNSNYYQDPIRKRRCKKNLPGAVLLHKKGEPKTDNNGKIIKEIITVASKEDRIFKFTSFKKWTDSIKKIVAYVKMTMITKTYLKIKKLSLITIDKQDSVLTIQKKIIKNQMLIRINKQLSELQNDIYLGYMNDKETIKYFNNLLYKINSIAYKTTLLLGKVSIYLGQKQSFANYRINIQELEDHIYNIINDFCSKNLEPYALGFLR